MAIRISSTPTPVSTAEPIVSDDSQAALLAAVSSPGVPNPNRNIAITPMIVRMMPTTSNAMPRVGLIVPGSVMLRLPPRDASP